MNKFKFLLILITIILMVPTILIFNYYKKPNITSFQVGIKYNSNKEWSLDYSEYIKYKDVLEKAKKVNYYDHNLYTYDIMPLDIVEFYYQANKLKVFIKPLMYEYNYFKHNKKILPELNYYYEEKTNYNMKQNFIISNKHYENYTIKNDKFRISDRPLIDETNDGYFKNFFIYYNQNKNKKLYSFIKLTHKWNIFDINSVKNSNKFESENVLEKDIIHYYHKDGGTNFIYKNQFIYKYQIIGDNLVYTENYFKDFSNNNVYRIGLTLNVDIKQYFLKKYNINLKNEDIKIGNMIYLEFEKGNYKKIKSVNILKSNWEELTFENLKEETKDKLVFLKNNKKFTLDKNIKLITATDNNFRDTFFEIKVEEEIDINLESKFHTFYIYYEKKDNDYIIKKILTIDDYNLINQFSK